MLVFSSNMACLATIIPAMDYMDSKLQSMSYNYKKHELALCMVLMLGLNLLDKYNFLINHSKVYQITISTSSYLTHINFDFQYYSPPFML